MGNSLKWGSELWEEMSPADKDAFVNHVLRTRVGSPDFRARGLMYSVYNNLWLFSNAQIQGMRASYESSRDNPADWAIKTFMYDIVPAVVAYSLAHDLPWLPSGTTPIPGTMATIDWDNLKRQYRHVSRYDIANYNVVPLFWIGSGTEADRPDLGKLAYLTLPKSHQGQIISNLIHAALDAGRHESPADLFHAIQRQLPINVNQATTHPVLSSMNDMLGYMQGIPPKDSYSGRYIVPPRTWNAARATWHTDGAIPAIEEVFPYAVGGIYNKLFGTAVLRYKPDEEVDERKTVQEWITGNVPVIGPAINRLVRVSDGAGVAQEIAYEANLLDDAASLRSVQRDKYIAQKLEKFRGEVIGGLPKIEKSDIYEIHKELEQQGLGLDSVGQVNKRVRDMIYDMSGRQYLSGIEDDSREQRIARLRNLLPGRDVNDDNWEECLNEIEQKALGFTLPRSMGKETRKRPGDKRRRRR